jgi:hypothetical protein
MRWSKRDLANEVKAQKARALPMQMALTKLAFYPPDSGIEASEAASAALEDANLAYARVVTEYARR